MNLQEHIKKVLREETGERTKLEKVITNVINRTLAEKELPSGIVRSKVLSSPIFSIERTSSKSSGVADSSSQRLIVQ